VLYDDAKLLPSRYTLSIIRFLEKISVTWRFLPQTVHVAFRRAVPDLDYECGKLFVTLTISLNAATTRMELGRKYNRGKNRKVAKRFNKLTGHSNGNYTYLHTENEIRRSSQHSFESKRNFSACIFKGYLAGILSSECA